MSNSHHPPRPPRYKLALLTWVGAYAVITLILQLLGPAMADWPLAIRTFAISALMVAALTWLVIPTMTRLFRGWLMPATPPASTPYAEARSHDTRRLAMRPTPHQEAPPNGA